MRCVLASLSQHRKSSSTFIFSTGCSTLPGGMAGRGPGSRPRVTALGDAGPGRPEVVPTRGEDAGAPVSRLSQD
jgi:hypothetical protein